MAARVDPAGSAGQAELAAQVVRAVSEVPEGLAARAGPAASAGQGALAASAGPEGQVESVAPADPAAREALAAQAGQAELVAPAVQAVQADPAGALAPRRGPLAVLLDGRT